MAGGGFGRWFVDVGLPGAQRNAFGQLDAGAVGRGIGFSALNQLAPGLGNFFARRYDQSHGAWDNSAGYLTDLTGNYGRATPDQLQGGTYQPANFGSFYQPSSFSPAGYGDNGWSYSADGFGSLDPSSLSNGLQLQNTIPDINRNIPAVNVGGSSGGGAPSGSGTSMGSNTGSPSGALSGWGTTTGPTYGSYAAPGFGMGWGWGAASGHYDQL